MQANVIHRNIVISACASVAAWSSAWAVLKNFRVASVEATAISSSLGSLPCGSLHDRLKVLEHVAFKGYGAAVASMKHGWHHALALSDALLLCGLRSNSIIMTSVAAALQQGRAPKGFSPGHALKLQFCSSMQAFSGSGLLCWLLGAVLYHPV